MNEAALFCSGEFPGITYFGEFELGIKIVRMIIT